MLKKLMTLLCTLPFIFMGKVYAQEENAKLYAEYDFVPGDSLIFEDNNQSDKEGAVPANWKIVGGQAMVESKDGEKHISIKKYYTSLAPKIKAASYLGAAYTIEFDYWLDAGYDGNPGVSIYLMNKEAEAVIIPNRNDFSCQTNKGRVTAETPPELFAEKFYNRWIHIAIAVANKTMKVYANQYAVLTVPDFDAKVVSLLVKGDESSDMSMLFKNFRLAKGGGSNAIGLAIGNGKYISHGIHFDVSKATVKPESMGEINAIAKAMKVNPTLKFEIGGHTDNDGEDAANMKLSESRAETVKQLLISMGIEESRLSIKGYGKTKPLGDNKTPEGKANNRRVEFNKL